MQPSDQAVGQFAPSEMDIDEGYVQSVLGEQALGLGCSRGWSDHDRSYTFLLPVRGGRDLRPHQV
jgi:hypothetical protein